MPLSRQTFLGANTDDADAERPASFFISATNLMLEPGEAYPITGNVLLEGYDLPAGDNFSLGALADGATGTGVELLYNSLGSHRLIRYDPLGNGGQGTRTTLLEWAGLNLQADLVLQGGVIDNIVIYRDASGELRAINLLRAAAGVYTPAYLLAEPFALHLVKVPPVESLHISRTLDSGISPAESLRIIQSKAYQFSYRYRYVDGEVPPQAPYTYWLDVLYDPATSGDTVYNAILLTLPGAIPAGVLEIEILVREANESIWQIADTIQRKNGILATSYRFYGQVFGSAVPDEDAVRLQEALWPCDTVALARNRVEVAGTREGYPTPEPAFTAIATTGNLGTKTGTLYTVQISFFEPGDPSQNGEPVPDKSTTYTDYYALATGDYPIPDSTYYLVSRTTTGAGQFAYTTNTSSTYSYDQAFVAPVVNEYDRTVTISQESFSTSSGNASDKTTFHENSTYRVAVQFYDALGRAGGCSAAQVVAIPKRNPGDVSYRSILATLTTTDPAALNSEIPDWADSYRFLVARNDRTTFFIQGEAADAFAYLGQVIKIREDNTLYEYPSLVDVTKNAHEKVRLDIGNFPAAGLGYQWTAGSGDRVRLLRENKDFLITNQVGDFIEFDWTDWPRQSLINGNSVPLIEIYSPNTSPSALYYERGPTLRIVRSVVNGRGQRSYSQTSVLLDGDCYLVSVSFPTIKKSDDYLKDPTNYKSYETAKAPTLIESMVPPFRFAPTQTITKTEYEKRRKGGFFSYYLQNPFALDGYLTAPDPETPESTSVTKADTALRTGASLLWLDVSYGGRPAIRIPLSLQQVYRTTLLRFSAPKQQGNLINGLSRWDALSQYDKLPAEQGPVTRLMLADQSQTDGSVLLALQRYGVASMYLSQQPIQAGRGGPLLAITNQVIGGDNTLRGGLGCEDPATVVAFAGMVFWYCRQRAELVRYNNGLTPLGLTYKFRTRLEDLTARYEGARVTGCFDPHRQEYWLTFHPTEVEPQATTIVWSERQQRWADEVSAIPTVGTGLNNELVTWLGGDLYRHLPSAPIATFYGVRGPLRVRFTVAKPDEAAKQWMSLEVRTNGGLWNATQLTTDTGQASRTRPDWWERREGVYRLTTGFRRNELSPGFTSIWLALDRGQPLVSPRLTVELTGPTTNPKALSMAVVSWLPRAGQNMAV